MKYKNSKILIICIIDCNKYLNGIIMVIPEH